HHATDGLREQEDAGEVGLHHRVPFVTRQILEAGANTIAGVVDEEIDPSERVERPRHQVRHLPRVAHVTDGRERATSLGTHRVGDRLERLTPAAAGDDVGADLRELDGDRAPDALAGAGDHGDAIAQRIGRKTHRSYWMTECVVATMRVTLVFSWSRIVGPFGAISF